MELISGAFDKILDDKDLDYTVRFIIENNFPAVQLKLASYGIPVKNTLEAYIAVIALNGTNAITDVLNVPYLNENMNGTGGLQTGQKRMFDGSFFNNVFSGLGNLFSGVGSGVSNVISSATGGTANIIGTTLGGVTGITGTALTGAQGITAPLLGGIAPSAQNTVMSGDGKALDQKEQDKKKNTTIIIISVVSLVIIIAIVVIASKASKSKA